MTIPSGMFPGPDRPCACLATWSKLPTLGFLSATEPPQLPTWSRYKLIGQRSNLRELLRTTSLGEFEEFGIGVHYGLITVNPALEMETCSIMHADWSVIRPCSLQTANINISN